MGDGPNGKRLLVAILVAKWPNWPDWVTWELLPSEVQEKLNMSATEYDRAAAERIAELESELAKGKRLVVEAVDLADKTCTEFEQCAAENATLRERLAKLETASLDAYKEWQVFATCGRGPGSCDIQESAHDRMYTTIAESMKVVE